MGYSDHLDDPNAFEAHAENLRFKADLLRDERKERGITQFTPESLIAANVTRKIDDGERLTEDDIEDLNYAATLVQERGTPKTGEDGEHPEP